jgi:hypothetical protein
VVTASVDTTARVWDVETGVELARLKGHTSAVPSASFSGDGKRIVTVAGDNTTRVWDTDTGKLMLTLPGTVGILFARFGDDGTRILTTSTEDGTLRRIIYDARPVNRAFVKPAPPDTAPRDAALHLREAAPPPRVVTR